MLRPSHLCFTVLGVVCACALSVLFSLPARGQVVFEDNFNGSALAPHWITPPASDWDYDVSGGMLNVHRALFPSHPKSPSNIAGIGTLLVSPLSGDFQANARIVWSQNTVPDVIFEVLGAGNAIIAHLNYYALGVAFFAPGSTSQLHPFDPVGTHTIGVTRNGTQLQFVLDGSLIGSFSDISSEPVTALRLAFRNAFPIPTGDPVRIDAIRLVPSCGTLTLGLVVAGCTSRRRRA